MGPITSTLTKSQATGLNGSVIDLTILQPGSGYTTRDNVCTYTVSKFDADQIQQTSFGCDKVDVLHVNITVGSNGEVLTVEPNDLKRGFFYKVGDTVSISKTGSNTDFSILQVSRVWPE